MAKTYRPYLPEQELLLPPSLRDWLPEGHLAYFVSDVIDQVDLNAIESYYEQEERGYPPYHPDKDSGSSCCAVSIRYKVNGRWFA